MRKFSILLSLVLIFNICNQASARDIINFNNGWRFGTTLNNSSNYKEINLPHLFKNSNLSVEERESFYYTKSFKAPSTWANKMVFVRFNGVATVATIFVNGRYVGEHRGAFTAFTFDITPYISVGSSNTITVNVENAFRYDTMPLSSESRIDGGIYRDVELIVTNKLHITPNHFSTNGVYFSQLSLNENEAKVGVTVMTRGEYGDKGNLRITIYDNDNEVSTITKPISIGLDGEMDFNQLMTINNPRRWWGRDDPFMYRCRVDILDINNKVQDSVTEYFGLRNIEVDRKRGFMLNNQPYPLYGVIYNEDIAGKGAALSDSDRESDIAIIKELGVTAIRNAESPHHNRLYDITDREGIVTWVDLPFTGEQYKREFSFISSVDFMNNGKLQLQEMIYQLHNHPSVVFIGLFSNISNYSDSPISFIKELNAIAKELSPNTLTVGCSNENGSINNITDVISWGQYFGWNSRKAEDITIWINGFKDNWHNIKPAIGEYGAGGSIYHQAEGAITMRNNNRWYPETSQRDFHITYSQALKGKPYIWGTFINSVFDHSVAYKSGGDDNGVSDMGLITRDRAVRKDAFYLYKALWSKDRRFIHISDKRLKNRSNNIQNIVIFSSCPSVDIIVNGVSQSTITVNNGVAAIKSLRLKQGKNVITARNGRISDTIEITVGSNLAL